MTARPSDRPVVTVLLRGVYREIEYLGAGGDAVWWWLPALDPPLTDYEHRAIEAIVRNDFAARQRAWIARKAERRVAADMRRRGAL